MQCQISILKFSIEIFFKNLDLDMKTGLGKLKETLISVASPQQNTVNQGELPHILYQIRNSQYHGLNNASESLEHAFIEEADVMGVLGMSKRYLFAYNFLISANIYVDVEKDSFTFLI
ncbi:unnamed protein product [Lactuca saligna]|uniref:Uncharacterized protein n=1 Tax=Lactuca saligna TaxID=75948 RepID=A0AA35Y5A2_LACSI|nr:unnamed protein product [Lactuca saligna]